MTTAHRFAGRRTVPMVLVAAACAAGACGGGDVGGSLDTGSIGTGAVGGAAAGIDTAAGKVNTGRTGSVVAPGPGQIPGTPGAVTGDSAAAKTKATRP